MRVVSDESGKDGECECGMVRVGYSEGGDDVRVGIARVVMMVRVGIVRVGYSEGGI